MIHHQTIATDDVDELFSWSQGWDFEIAQLSPGALGYHSELVMLPGVTLRWERWGQRLRNSHLNHSSNVSIGLLIAAERAPVWQGVEVNTGQALVFGSVEQEYVSPEGMRSLNIEIARELLATWGLAAPAGGLVDVEPAAMRRLLAACRQASALPPGDSTPANSRIAQVLRERIVARLVEALGGVDPAAATDIRTATQQRRFTLVKEAERAALACNREIDSERLASELHVSWRTLHRAVKEWAGVGPQAYFQLLRLHRFRRQLLLFRAPGESITAAAHALGFENMGRLSRLYRSYFGELPRQTRRRVSD
ncbi:MAG: AraC family transcriptional regulator [Candidatus Accumulibacter sp.]|uniref:AraC family transcriptional regulator n=1 Tax=Accumulibacter sp. TaxID=2053492 RepID=UPI0025DD4EDF|nr:AraC family transcriptional regulator [Accumulibacter sp.]MCP5247067.1 AraC family transcriptional regulator [Accumulibacter sp.]